MRCELQTCFIASLYLRPAGDDGGRGQGGCHEVINLPDTFYWVVTSVSCVILCHRAVQCVTITSASPRVSPLSSGAVCSAGQFWPGSEHQLSTLSCSLLSLLSLLSLTPQLSVTQLRSLPVPAPHTPQWCNCWSDLHNQASIITLLELHQSGHCLHVGPGHCLQTWPLLTISNSLWTPTSLSSLLSPYRKHLQLKLSVSSVSSNKLTSWQGDLRYNSLGLAESVWA